MGTFFVNSSIEYEVPTEENSILSTMEHLHERNPDVKIRFQQQWSSSLFRLDRQTSSHKMIARQFAALCVLLVPYAVSSYTIQVCQNKDCCRRFQGKASNLAQTLEQILPSDTAIKVETTGCLSQCGHGPNICVKSEDGEDEKFLNGIETAYMAAASLEILDPSLSIPSTKLAAWNCMEKSLKGMYIFLLP